jgi:predicted dithiol-disulfide oxidoreductase (DUF899 family)
MTDHKIGTRAEWQAARHELAKLEAEHAERNAEIKRRRLELPWDCFPARGSRIDGRGLS